MPTHDALVVSSRDLTRIVERIGVHRLMDDLIVALADALQRYDTAATQVVKRSGFTYAHPRPGVLEWMPAMEVGRQAVLKVVSYNPGNPEAYGMPTIVSTISLYDIATGRLLALLDGMLPTAVRTGAASAVASTVLARPDSGVVGLVGCGAQAVTQLHALSCRFDIRGVLVYDIDARVGESFAERVAFLDLPVRVAPRDVLERESDIICTATSVEPGKGPVIEADHCQSWVHVNAVGSDLPGKTELPLALLRRSLVCPDFVEQALVEGEAQLLTRDDLGPSLPDLVKGGEEYAIWRDRPTVFDSTGFALEDVVIAELLMDYASRLSVGQRLPLQGLDGDPHDPYEALDLSAGAGDVLAALRRPV